MIELACRESGSLHVVLLWIQEADRFLVCVDDRGTRDDFELVVDEADALDAYYHPYAYAASRGVDYRAAA